MNRFGQWAMMLLAAAAPVSASAATPTPLPMASKWQLDYTNTACRLLASFGADGDTVEFSQADPRGPLALTFVSKIWPDTMMSRPVAVGINDPDHFLPLHSIPVPPVGAMRLLYLPYTDKLREALDAAAAPGKRAVLTVTTAGRTRSFAIGSVAPLLSAFDRCMDDLVKTWGFDPAEQRAASPPQPIGSAADWFKADDYPGNLVRDGLGGGTDMRLDIDTAGQVTGCHVQEAGGAAELQALSCRLLKERGHFTPAKTKAGVPIATYHIFRVLWHVQ